ncbi:MAG: hypothetical protein ABEI06_04225 [Halobacteriaceae archaeon]
MQSHPALVIIASLIIITAGCGTYLGGSPSKTTPLTTAPVDEQDLPPGVSQSGFTNVSLLLSQHRSVLANSSFQIKAQSKVILNKGNQQITRNTSQQSWVAAGLSPFYVTIEANGSRISQTVHFWGNATTAVSQQIRAEQVRYQPFPAQVNKTNFLTFTNTLRGYLKIGNFSVTDVESTSQGKVYTLTAISANVTRETQLRGINITDYSAQVTVSSKGVIRSLTVDLTSKSPQGTTEFHLQYNLLKRGDVSVPKPKWIDKALKKTIQVTVTADIVQQKYITLTHTSGESIPSNSFVVLRGGKRQFSSQLQKSLKKNETIYLYIPQNSRRVKISSTRPVNVSARNLKNITTLSIIGPNGGRLVQLTFNPNSSH